MACCDDVKTQNDLADFIQKIIALLQKLAGFFDSLNATQATTQALGPCEAAFVDGLKEELLAAVARLPGRVQSYINCKFGFAPQASTQSLVGLGSLLTLLPQLLKYLPELLKYLPQLMALIKQLQEMLKNAGGTGGTGAGPTQPVMPNDYSPKSVNRCG